jgi:hypothetical protein
MDNNRPERPQDIPPVNNLTGKDVMDESGKLAKDVVRTSLVWTLSGFITKALRAATDRMTKSS